MTNNSENEASLQLSDTTIHGINNVIMTPEPTLNAHNKDEFPPAHNTMGSSLIKLFVLLFGTAFLCGCNSNDSAENKSYNMAEIGTSEDSIRNDTSNSRLAQGPTSRLRFSDGTTANITNEIQIKGKVDSIVIQNKTFYAEIGYCGKGYRMLREENLAFIEDLAIREKFRSYFDVSDVGEYYDIDPTAIELTQDGSQFYITCWAPNACKIKPNTRVECKSHLFNVCTDNGLRQMIVIYDLRRKY